MIKQIKPLVHHGLSLLTIDGVQPIFLLKVLVQLATSILSNAQLMKHSARYASWVFSDSAESFYKSARLLIFYD